MHFFLLYGYEIGTMATAEALSQMGMGLRQALRNLRKGCVIGSQSQPSGQLIIRSP